MTSGAKKRVKFRWSDAMHALFFAVAIIGLFFFSYVNLFEFQLGMSGVTAIKGDAADLYGMRLDVHGIIENVTSSEFELVDAITGDRIDAVWLGQGDLPSNGTEIIAKGQVVKTSIGPIILANNVSVLRADEPIFYNAWTLPTLRLLVVFLLWLIISVLISCALAIIYFFKRNLRIAHIMRAMSETSLIAGTIAILIIALISISNSLSINASSFVLLAIPPVIAISISIRAVRNQWIAMFADAIPLIAGAMIFIWFLLNLVQEQMQVIDFISNSILTLLSESFVPMAIGVIGLTCLFLYISSLRIEGMRITSNLALSTAKVK